jgi:hypothetical protein
MIQFIAAAASLLGAIPSSAAAPATNGPVTFGAFMPQGVEAAETGSAWVTPVALAAAALLLLIVIKKAR